MKYLANYDKNLFHRGADRNSIKWITDCFADVIDTAYTWLMNRGCPDDRVSNSKGVFYADLRNIELNGVRGNPGETLMKVVDDYVRDVYHKEFLTAKFYDQKKGESYFISVEYYFERNSTFVIRLFKSERDPDSY